MITIVMLLPTTTNHIDTMTTILVVLIMILITIAMEVEQRAREAADQAA